MIPAVNFTIKRKSTKSEIPDSASKTIKTCSVTDCEQWRNLSAKTTYHCFPAGEANIKRWEIWTTLIRKARNDEQWIPFRGSLVCSQHFTRGDFICDPNALRSRLRRTAIPSIFPEFTINIDTEEFSKEQANDDSEEGGNLNQNLEISENSSEYNQEDENDESAGASGDNDDSEENVHYTEESADVAATDGDASDYAPVNVPTTSTSQQVFYSLNSNQQLDLQCSLPPGLEIEEVDLDPNDIHYECRMRIKQLEMENKELREARSRERMSVRLLQQNVRLLQNKIRAQE